MSHKADESFFEYKRDWSRKKDRILERYLKPYLTKVKNLQRPILLVDGFAGPGKFGPDKGGSSEDGSPLILAKRAESLVSSGFPVELLCIEADKRLYENLQHNLTSYPFARARHGQFLDCIPEISKRAQSQTCFLYVDPYTVKGLDWNQMEQVMRCVVDLGSSVEILMNFSVRAFVRWGWQVLKDGMSPPGVTRLELEEMDTEEYDPEAPALERLNEIVGGDWWQRELTTSSDFQEQCIRVVDGVRKKLSDSFKEVLCVPVRTRP